MKKLMVFLCFLMMGGVAMAQAPKHLKGPAAKNYKYWQDKDKNDQSGSTLVAHENKPQLTGPAAKNRKAWDKDKNQKFRAVKSGNLHKDLKGPKYKNMHPWERVETEASDVADELPKKKENDIIPGREK